MARVKIDAPENFSFSCSIPVRITDLNFGNHVGNDAFISIMHEARVQFLSSLGYSELSVDGNGLIMADLTIVFKNESYYGDILKIEMVVSNLSLSSFDLYYHISTKRENTALIIAQAKTAQVCYNYHHKKIAKLSEKFIAAINNQQI